jgi:hypothetical protein
VGSKGGKRTSVLGLYEATDILLLLVHATIYHFNATLKSKSTNDGYTKGKLRT